MINPVFSMNNRLDSRIAGLSKTAGVIAIGTLLTVSGCSSTKAPVVDRTTSVTTGAPSQLQSLPLEPPPPGYYRVKRGDTLYRIALENGQSYRDIAQWNNLSNPNQIEVDQLLRVVPPGSERKTATAVPVSVSAVDGKPIDGKPAAAGTSTSEAPLSLTWPVKGQVVGRFDDSKNKGIDIAGKVGDPVAAAADGKVIYAGSELRGFGNLIIIKHDASWLTAYGHNRELLVKEGEAVKRGQKIATMGNSDADRVKLHFEVRRDSKPVDPMKYLPAQ